MKKVLLLTAALMSLGLYPKQSLPKTNAGHVGFKEVSVTPFDHSLYFEWDDTIDSSYVDKYGDTTYTKKDETWKVYY